jgi:hypothetical protein
MVGYLVKPKDNFTFTVFCCVVCTVDSFWQQLIGPVIKERHQRRMKNHKDRIYKVRSLETGVNLPPPPCP